MRLSDKYPFLTNYFTMAINRTNRALPQSILFYGSDLEAQYTFAQEIARLLNCTGDKSDECDCLNCKWINDGTHPAVMTITRIDNKPEKDETKTVISVKQSQMIKEQLVTSSDFHRVYIFCDRDDEGNIAGLNRLNFQDETANSMLKIIEEPQPGVTFIFLTRYKDDVLSTIVSRSQCFFVPTKNEVTYDYTCINGIFTDYFNYERNQVFYISQKLQDLAKESSVENVLMSIQNYMLALLKSNPNRTELIKHIEYVENANRQAQIGLKSSSIFDDLCLKIIN